MMTKCRGQQIELHLITIEDLVPMDHLFRKVNDIIDFSFIYDEVENLYCSNNGRPSIDPVVLVRFLLIGFLYGINSERRISEEIQVNMAYRWFLGLDIMDKVPDHSTISQNRRRRFNCSGLFRRILQKTVAICIEKGLADGKLVFTDSTHIKANASRKTEYIKQVEEATNEYLEELFSNYKIDCDLKISIDDIFHNIYDRILKYGPLFFYKQIYKELYKAFDREERRIRINNGENTEFPTLLIYSIRALSENNAKAENDVYDETYMSNVNDLKQLFIDTKYAIRLLDVDNEYDLGFLLPGDESVYLKHIMNYSSVYDIHQYVPDGMLFLIQRIIDAYSKRLEKYYNCDSKNLYNIISRLVRNAQCDFEAGIISTIPFKSVSSDERNILD